MAEMMMCAMLWTMGIFPWIGEYLCYKMCSNLMAFREVPCWRCHE
jgi:hypothetical protein